MKIRIISHAIGAPHEKMWGDYWVLYHLSHSFREMGHDILSMHDPHVADLNLYLVGEPFDIHRHAPARIHAAWHYSHIEPHVINTLNQYTFVMCLGLSYTSTLTTMINCPVFTLLGCTHIVPPINIPLKTKDVVFCGNTKILQPIPGTYERYGRKIIDDLDPARHNLNLEIYGVRWNNFPKSLPYWKGEYIDNLQLNTFYGSAKIALNDSTPDMIRHGYVTIRVYDIVASGALCISANTKDLDNIFGDAVVTYESPEELLDLVRYYINHDEERNTKIYKGMKIIQEQKMFYKTRAQQIISYYEQFI